MSDPYLAEPTIDRLFQSSHNVSNPIMSHSVEIWTKMHKMHKLSHCKQIYSSLWHNPMFSIGRTKVYWKKCHLDGLCHVAREGMFMSVQHSVQGWKPHQGLPVECHQAFIFHRTTNQLGSLMDEEKWLRIISNNGK